MDSRNRYPHRSGFTLSYSKPCNSLHGVLLILRSGGREGVKNTISQRRKEGERKHTCRGQGLNPGPTMCQVRVSDITPWRLFWQANFSLTIDRLGRLHITLRGVLGDLFGLARTLWETFYTCAVMAKWYEGQISPCNFIAMDQNPTPFLITPLFKLCVNVMWNNFKSVKGGTIEISNEESGFAWQELCEIEIFIFLWGATCF